MALRARPTRPKTVFKAERRQLTVMFCDLVDSTALSERLDPEEYRDVVEIYRRACGAVIKRFEGHIAQYLGDGLFVYFGYPIAHEDDPRRAVHSGLGILDALHQVNQQTKAERGVELIARVGIHTGLVVVGETGGRGRQSAVGETPNVAARLQSLALPGTLLVGAATHRLVQHFFTFQDLGRHMIKGLSSPLRVYRVLGENAGENPLEDLGIGRPRQLIGRQTELQLLLDRWFNVSHGGSEIVLLSGEAGIGKSRLVQALRDHVGDERYTRLECRCSPYHQHTALYPVIELIQRLIAQRPEDTAVERLQKLEAVLTRYYVPLAEVVPLFAALLTLPLPEGRYPALTINVQRKRARTLDAILMVLGAIAALQPSLLIIEDLHWVDPTTAELLTRFVQKPPAALLTLMVSRPEFQPPWKNVANQTVISLRPLTRDNTVAMITHIAGGKHLPQPVIQRLVANTDGNPLFVEELTKMVLESGLLHEVNDRYELVGTISALAIPTTLHDSLVARLDRLGSAKAVAQLAAVLGRAFQYDLLCAVSPVDSVTLKEALTRLVDAELVYEQSSPPHAAYIFKHALIQEAAYQSLLRSTRQQYHQLVAEKLATKFPEVAEIQPELLAHHYTEAGLGVEAIPFWRRAGQQAIERSANEEAISHLTKGLQQVIDIGDGPQRIQQELEFQIMLGGPLMATQGYTAQDVEKVFGRALELCSQVGETPQLFNALRGLRQFYQIRGDYRTAYDIGTQLLRQAETVQDLGMLLEAHYALGSGLYWLGEFCPANEHFERVIELYKPLEHRSHAYLYGNDPGVVAKSYSAWTLWYLGYPDKSLLRLQEAQDLAREVPFPFSLTSVFAYASALHYFRREAQPTLEWASRCISLASEHGFPFWLAMGTVLRGWAVTKLGQSAEGIDQLRQGIATWRALRTELARPQYLGMLAEALAGAGQKTEAFEVLDEAVATVSAKADHTYEAVDVYHLKGELLLTQGNYAEAEECFRHTIELAERQCTKSWELRATISLSRLWQRQGKRSEAYRRLAEIYGWFTEGLDTAEAQAGRLLLQELGNDEKQ